MCDPACRSLHALITAWPSEGVPPALYMLRTFAVALTPLPAQALRESRVKGILMDHREVCAAMGVRIVAPGLEHSVAGTSLFVVRRGGGGPGGHVCRERGGGGALGRGDPAVQHRDCK